MKSEILSYWGVPLNGRFTDNNSNDTLCIILPGIAYHLDRSYLDYSKKLALSMKMDVFEMEYGFQITRTSFDISSQFEILASESISTILNIIKKPYKNYVIIAKSIGTCIQVLLNKQLSSSLHNIKNIVISPINKTVNLGIPQSSLVFTGLSDPWITLESIQKIRNINNIRLITIDNANHSLDIPGNVLKTLDILKENFLIIKDFL